MRATVPKTTVIRSTASPNNTQRVCQPRRERRIDGAVRVRRAKISGVGGRFVEHQTLAGERLQTGDGDVGLRYGVFQRFGQGVFGVDEQSAL